MKKKILFICQCNLNRSPTFENYFKDFNEYDVKSTGVHYGFQNKLTRDLLDWADQIYVMDLEQYEFLFLRHNSYIKKVEIIGISDQYDPDDPRLIQLIALWYSYIKNGTI